jgi:toxin ParE1/3/4
MKATRLVIEPEAEAELEEAADRYESNVVGLGLAFLVELRRRTRDVLETPEGFPLFGTTEGVRCAHAVGRFPHLVVYMLNGDVVHVLAYMHPRQRPGYWAHRAP